jgi:hypothetical protein
MAKIKLLVKEFIGKRHITSSRPGHTGCSPQAMSSSLQFGHSHGSSFFVLHPQARQDAPKKKNERESFKSILLRRSKEAKNEKKIKLLFFF